MYVYVHLCLRSPEKDIKCPALSLRLILNDRIPYSPETRSLPERGAR